MGIDMDALKDASGIAAERGDHLGNSCGSRGQDLRPARNGRQPIRQDNAQDPLPLAPEVAPATIAGSQKLKTKAAGRHKVRARARRT
jgi:hypothetical protein